MSWHNDLLHLACWAMQNQDLRHRFLHAQSPSDLTYTPGIENALEVSIVLAIYESAIAKGYSPNKTIDYERSYPDESNGNPKRADLAFKEPGKGKNWGFVEVKCYNNNGKSRIQNDINKLNAIKTKVQRWLLCYRVRPDAQDQTKTINTLENLLVKNFGNSIMSKNATGFKTITQEGELGFCDIVLVRLR